MPPIGKVASIVTIMLFVTVSRLSAQHDHRQENNRVRLAQFLGPQNIVRLQLVIDTLKKSTDSLVLELESVKMRERQTYSYLSQALAYARLFGNPQNTDTGKLKNNANALNLPYRIEPDGRISFEIQRNVAEYFFDFYSGTHGFEWPVLEKLKQENKVNIEIVAMDFNVAPGTQVPQIEIPSFASVAATSNAQKIALAQRYMQYITGLFTRYPRLDPVILRDYKNLERQKLPDSNPDKLIDLRLRFIIFMKENTNDIII